MPADPIDQCEAVVWCIAEGSKFPSCFLHFTKDIEVARFWRDKGRKDRRDNENYLVRLDASEIDRGRVSLGELLESERRAPQALG